MAKKKIEDKTPVNEGAEYIILELQGRKIYVDMRDIIDIKLSNQFVIIDNVQKPLYVVIFNDMTMWQILDISEETLKTFEKFKERRDKNGGSEKSKSV